MGNGGFESDHRDNRENGSGFALIIVLFILLIIVGASFLNYGGC
ncbi:YjcZ family sporulation protein [Viridibacillus sp. YIM B01967]|uniref:YjcZ family sporulation protein n=1 Tax=Viridibacillus soli TaxID=2798301 RepID=A0ABS1HB54_9BACL|nr:YjcZ family sporulation protein [Viridibacillus soli]MBK3496317.1 YjcZ family sporulation protein [Viridibacillus soli]